ncbi:MAG: hypothetical protein HUU55_22975 [Myxococcales bacterium]|nr:hypothetical protein [Myxococcales bacterium]
MKNKISTHRKRLGNPLLSTIVVLSLAGCGNDDTNCEGPSCGIDTAQGFSEAGTLVPIDTGFGSDLVDSIQQDLQSDGLSKTDMPWFSDVDTCSPATDGCCDLTLWEREWDPDCRKAAVVLDSLAIEAATPALDTQNETIHLVFRRAMPTLTVYQRRHAENGLLGYEQPLGDGIPLCPVLLPNGDVLVLTRTQLLRIGATEQTANDVATLPAEPTGCPAWVSDTLVVPIAGGLTAIDTSTGVLKWTWAAPEGEDVSAPAAANSQENGVVVATSAGHLWWIHLTTGDATKSKPGTLSLSVGNPVPAGDGIWIVAGLGIKAEPWIGRWAWSNGSWSEPLDEPLVGQPAINRESTLAEDGSILVHKSGGGWVEIDPTLLTLRNNPSGVLHVTTTPTVLQGENWVVGTTNGIEAVQRNGTMVVSQWRYNIDELVTHAPLVLPSGDVLILGATTLYRVVAQQGPLADTPWPRVRGGWNNRGVVQ